MFIVQLKFSTNKHLANDHMVDHNKWIVKGFDDGVFLVVGSLKPNLGGGIIAHNITLPDLQTRVETDPFVEQGIVTAEIIELSPARTDERLSFLLSG